MTATSAVKDSAQPALTETVDRCPLCDGNATKELFAAKDRWHSLPGEFGLHRCRDCQFVFLSPRPTAERLGFYYPPAEYYSYHAPDLSALAAPPVGWRRKLQHGLRRSVFDAMGYNGPPLTWWQRLLQPLAVRLLQRRATYSFNYFPRYVAGGRALEVGSGAGVYLCCLKMHGWDVVGVELSAEAAATAQQAYGVEVKVGALAPAMFAPASFDYIYLSDVIEHLPDPVAAARMLACWLKSGGTMFIQTPNIESYAARRWGRWWYGLEAPRHLCLFSPETLTQLLRGAGLSVMKLETRPALPGCYQWEFTYRYEEEQGCRLTQRPHIKPRDWPAAVWLRMAAQWRWLRDPLSGEVIRCLVTKE
jgi:2-polyprenyl-3-methyl-5-hydroxy-6-metoxy-1,4-benzoquinol methylase